LELWAISRFVKSLSLPPSISHSYPIYIMQLDLYYTNAPKPQTITLPLRFQVEIFSGISPPAALLSAMASRPSNANPTSSTNPSPASAAPAPPPRPPNEANALYPPQLTNNAHIAEVDDAPPSYEDAIADELNIVPADGPRREYSGVTDENAPGMDEKGGAAPSYEAQGSRR
jgi:hypothetical protein